MVKNLNKQFYWEDITVPNKRMKKVFNTTDNQESANQSPSDWQGQSGEAGTQYTVQVGLYTGTDNVENRMGILQMSKA